MSYSVTGCWEDCKTWRLGKIHCKKVARFDLGECTEGVPATDMTIWGCIKDASFRGYLNFATMGCLYRGDGSDDIIIPFSSSYTQNCIDIIKEGGKYKPRLTITKIGGTDINSLQDIKDICCPDACRYCINIGEQTPRFIRLTLSGIHKHTVCCPGTSYARNRTMEGDVNGTYLLEQLAGYPCIWRYVDADANLLPWTRYTYNSPTDCSGIPTGDFSGYGLFIQIEKTQLASPDNRHKYEVSVWSSSHHLSRYFTATAYEADLEDLTNDRCMGRSGALELDNDYNTNCISPQYQLGEGGTAVIEDWPPLIEIS